MQSGTVFAQNFVLKKRQLTKKIFLLKILVSDCLLHQDACSDTRFSHEIYFLRSCLFFNISLNFFRILRKFQYFQLFSLIIDSCIKPVTFLVNIRSLHPKYSLFVWISNTFYLVLQVFSQTFFLKSRYFEQNWPTTHFGKVLLNRRH